MGLAVFVFTVFAMAQVVHGSAIGGYTTVTVEPGDSVWSIASARYPSADPRQKVQEILDANGLRSPEIYAGEQLKVPAS
jgi:LysM repeat protein